MLLTNLQIQQYRNLDSMELSLDSEIILFVGQNAQGKTNILESIYVLAMAKSHRTNKDRELIAWNEDFARLGAYVHKKNGPLSLEIQLTNKGKKAKVNGLEQRKLSNYIGALNVVMFAPEDLDIVKGNPSIRRRFIDMEIGQVSPLYLHLLSQYQKLIHQRNQALKESYIDLIEVYNMQMAELSAKILHKRMEFIDKLQVWANEIHSQITSGREKLSLRYQSTFSYDKQMNEKERIEQIFHYLQSIREKEVMRGISLAGPHRDDIYFSINDKSVQQYGSQGQQRTTALSLKLAEIELIYQEVGEYPLLLLDDVLSELDANRQSHLLTGIKNRVQTFVTSTGVEGLNHDTLKHASLFRVDHGKVTQEM